MGIDSSQQSMLILTISKSAKRACLITSDGVSVVSVGYQATMPNIQMQKTVLGLFAMQGSRPASDLER
jgi:hypothetical protein